MKWISRNRARQATGRSVSAVVIGRRYGPAGSLNLHLYDIGSTGHAGHVRTRKRVEEAAMRAQVGDLITIEGNTVGRHARQGTILEVRSPDGQPPYLVRWEDGHEALTYPGPDAHVTPSADSTG